MQKINYPPRPLRFELELTTSCMNRCKICGDVLIRTKGVYMKRWKEIVDKIVSETYNTKYSCSIRLTGGEPTLHPDFFEIVEYIDRLGIEHGLFTTGCWDHLDAEKLLNTYNKCNNFSNFLISLHGATPAVHTEFTRREGSFEEACKYIELASDNGLSVVTNTVLTSHSVNQIEEIVELSESLGAQASLFERLFAQDDDILEPNQTQLINSLKLVTKLRQQGKNCITAMCLPRCLDESVKDTLKSGFEIATISTLGQVRPSNLTSYSYGNILQEGSTIEDIWSSSQAEKYRNMLKPQCLDCSELSICRGGLKFQTKNGTLSFDKNMGVEAYHQRPFDYNFNLSATILPNFQLIPIDNKLLLACHSSSIFVENSALEIINDIQKMDKPIEFFKQKYNDEGLSFLAYLEMNHFVVLN